MVFAYIVVSLLKRKSLLFLHFWRTIELIGFFYRFEHFYSFFGVRELLQPEYDDSLWRKAIEYKCNFYRLCIMNIFIG